MDNVIAILNQDIDFQEKLRNICLELYNEEVDVYREEKGNLITYEVHFNDDNYYEIDYSKTGSVESYIDQIQKHLICERMVDLKSKNIYVNRNNIRFLKKYMPW